MKYIFYAISSDKSGIHIEFKCTNMGEEECLRMSEILPHRHDGKEMSYYIISNDFNFIAEISYGRIVAILLNNV